MRTDQELHYVCSFSSDFSGFSHYICINYYIRKYKQTMYITYQQWWQWSTSYSSSFPDVLVIYPLITILGNAHRPYEQHPNIVSNCLQHASSFLLIISDFLSKFTLLAMLGNAHRPHKHTNIVDNGIHISLYFFVIFSHFLAIFTLITILRNAHRPCKLYLNIINNSTSCLPFFSWCSHYIYITYYIRKCAQTMSAFIVISQQFYN